MIRITEDSSSGSLVQYLAKIPRMVLSCPLTWTWSVLWRSVSKQTALILSNYSYNMLP